MVKFFWCAFITICYFEGLQNSECLLPNIECGNTFRAVTVSWMGVTDWRMDQPVG